MNEVATLSRTLLIDRGKRKVRVNYIDGNKIMGYIVPV